MHQRKLYAQVGLLVGFIQHSCSANVWPIDCDGDTIFVAIRPIRAGEELFINYYGFHWDLNGERGFKDDEMEMKCQCDKCKFKFKYPSQNEIEMIAAESDFKYLLAYYHWLEMEQMGHNTFYNMKKASADLLTKYGRMFWSRELDFVATCYVKLITAEYSGTIQLKKTMF